MAIREGRGNNQHNKMASCQQTQTRADLPDADSGFRNRRKSCRARTSSSPGRVASELTRQSVAVFGF